MSNGKIKDLGFTHNVAKNGTVSIAHYGKLATRLHGSKAISFLEDMSRSAINEQQQLMAKLTGNYKRGNERQAKNHPRNKF